MLEIAAVAEKYDLIVLSDEIYERLVYGVEHINFASLPGMYDRTILMSGMSKSFAMTGWRIGYVSASREIMEAIRKLHQYLIMSASTIGQVAALEALTHGETDVRDMRGEYDSAPPIDCEWLQRTGVGLLRATRRILCLPEHRGQRHER